MIQDTKSRPTRRDAGLVAGLAALAAPALLLARPARAEGMESTFDRIQRTKVLRVAALTGEAPYFFKDLVSGQWSGASADMAENVAAIWDAKLEYVPSTYGNSVLDLQSNKVDLGFSLNPTPQRALSIGFTQPMITHPFGAICRKGFEVKTWDDLNKPEVRIVTDLGSTNEVAARRFAPRAQITSLQNRDDAILALQSGRADADVVAAMLGITALAKNPTLGKFVIPTGPVVSLPSSIGIRREPDTRFREVLDAWLLMNHGIGQIREWMINGILKSGARREDIPSELTF